MTTRTRAPWLAAGLLWAALAAGQDDPSDSRWPLRLEAGADRVTVYAPAWESFADGRLAGRAAVSVAAPGAEPVFGAVELDCRVTTDREARTARIVSARVAAARFPGLSGSPGDLVEGALHRELAERPLVLSLDKLVARVEAAGQEALQLEHAPPRIVFRDHPAVKVQYDGAPRLGEVEDSSLMRVINTPFLVVFDPAGRTWYLRGLGRWFSAPDAMGPFQDAADVPREATLLAEKLGVPEAPPEMNDDLRAAAVEVVTATEPTELIWMDGAPEYTPVAGTDLLYIANTPSDVFLHIASQRTYVLLSGRWYCAPGRDGPWQHVAPDRLPGDFSLIPAGGPKGSVLAHVEGTSRAAEALLENAVPETAKVDRQAAERPPVTYDGDPRFVEVAGQVLVRYAANTSFAVFQVRGLYYCCWNGVWYEARTPYGDWEVCAVVPRELYELPPSNPHYSVRYVYVYESEPDYVVCGYLPGYFGYYPWCGTVVYGTGHHYRPWWGRHYYPRFWTFGFGARYRHHNHCWSHDVGWGGPSLWLNLRIGTGGWSVGATFGVTCSSWWGYGGYRHVDRRPGPAPAPVAVNLYTRPRDNAVVVTPPPPPSWRDARPPSNRPPDNRPPSVRPPDHRPPSVRPPVAERPREEHPRMEVPRVEPPRAERPRVEVPRLERPRTEVPRVEPHRVERPRVEVPRAEPPRVERPPVVERPRTGWPWADRPQGERPPVVERPRTGWPWADRPQGERPPVVERPRPEPPPAFEDRSEDRPRFERPPAFEDRSEDRPRFERPPAFEDRSEDRPRFERPPESRQPERSPRGWGAERRGQVLSPPRSSSPSRPPSSSRERSRR